jgi:exoribonuclease R
MLAGEGKSPLPLGEIADAASGRERKAADAEQALVEWRIFRLLKGRLGEEFGGIVVDVIKAGLIVELDEYFVSGLLPFGSLRGDYEPKPAGRRLRPKRSRKTFDVGDAVRVVLASCDPALRRMGFVPAPEPEEKVR